MAAVCPVNMVQRTEKLRARLEPRGILPEDYKPERAQGREVEAVPYDVVLAEIRHDYTNYEELLNKMPLCAASEPDWPGCHSACPFLAGHSTLAYMGVGCQCPYPEQAHDGLKWAAKGLAERIFQEWLSKNPKMRTVTKVEFD